MLIRMEHANITVKSIDEAVRFLKLVFPEFEKRGEQKSHPPDYPVNRRRISRNSNKTPVAATVAVIAANHHGALLGGARRTATGG